MTFVGPKEYGSSASLQIAPFDGFLKRQLPEHVGQQANLTIFLHWQIDEDDPAIFDCFRRDIAIVAKQIPEEPTV